MGFTPFVFARHADPCDAATVATDSDLVVSRRPAGSEVAGIAPHKGPVVQRCACGEVGIRSDNWHVWDQERATWFCSPCYAKRKSEA